jgi:Concanavalin A-like lectin/glucanases superfamily
MTQKDGEIDELHELVELLCEQRISDAQLNRLQQLVRSDPVALRFYVDYLDLHAQFMWRSRWFSTRGSTEPLPEKSLAALPPIAPSCDALVGAEPGHSASPPSDQHPSSHACALPPAFDTAAPPLGLTGKDLGPPCGPDVTAEPGPAPRSGFSVGAGLLRGGMFPSFFAMGSVVGLLLLGACIYAYRTSEELRLAEDKLIRLEQLQRDSESVKSRRTGNAPYTATLVNVTNCRWDKSRSTADVASGGLRPGQSLHLVEGVAKMTSALPGGGVAEFQLEGPLAMMLTSEGMPSLLYGRLTGSFACDFDRFILDTPLGRVIIPGDASLGVMAAANEVEVHVFSGAAQFECWSNGTDVVPELSSATSGTSIRARIGDDGRLSVEHGKARENGFVTPSSLTASRLLISDEYVAAIRNAKPLGYWRFESDEGGLVRNEMGDRLHCRIVGDAIRLQSGPGNRSAEFRATSGPGYLISDDVIDEVGESYSAEAWVKPAYYHHALLFSLVDPSEALQLQHRFLIELCGPGPGQPTLPYRPWENHPDRIRFLHRGRWQAYSTLPYVLRKWQHVAVVKDTSELRLYVDGQLIATAEGRWQVGNGLHVLMGQLYPQDPGVKDEVASRLFVGELDEVAFYDRALSQDEIQLHYRTARPDAVRAPADSF